MLETRQSPSYGLAVTFRSVTGYIWKEVWQSVLINPSSFYAAHNHNDR